VLLIDSVGTLTHELPLWAELLFGLKPVSTVGPQRSAVGRDDCQAYQRVGVESRQRRHE
jgi:hypothetical protein